MAVENNELYKVGLAHAEALEKLGVDLYPAEPFRRTHLAKDLITNFDHLKGQVVRIAGRIVAFRDHGNLVFADIEDESGSIQTVNTKKELGDSFSQFREHYWPGDFIGTVGELTKTRRGEISVLANTNTMLAKALRPAPAELSDPEEQQRQRYLHTLIDREARDRFRFRSGLVQHMRQHFIDNMGCLEVETPILDTTYGGAVAKPFSTYHNALGEKLFLRISNELYLKRMTVGGYYEGVFEFSRDFRNEGMDRTHNPEFTQVELYRPFWDYKDMMGMMEELIESAAIKLKGSSRLPFGVDSQGQPRMVDLRRPWRRLTIYDGVEEKYGIHPGRASIAELRKIALDRGVINPEQAAGITKGDLTLELFDHAWEAELIDPTFVMDYPDDTSALTKRHRIYPELTERFECVAGGLETANCYTELNDPRDQRIRFELERSKRDKGSDETMPFDEDYIRAQEFGMPQQAGIGISIDRWTMIMNNLSHIRQAIYFPTLKPR